MGGGCTIEGAPIVELPSNGNQSMSLNDVSFSNKNHIKDTWFNPEIYHGTKNIAIVVSRLGPQILDSTAEHIF